jgi:hypothetical protein
VAPRPQPDDLPLLVGERFHAMDDSLAPLSREEYFEGRLVAALGVLRNRARRRRRLAFSEQIDTKSGGHSEQKRLEGAKPVVFVVVFEHSQPGFLGDFG